ncbi:hypothetical protein P872_09915 [Rhodonellum psychrophilum GCM71 = DSM 17998]|uniref:Uncharacterized protein n=1 Tax=Rhodonellum psychrophilum GCM71 = DSM 17998 TaxID=1123057 RepID=U5BZX9_9BACT|nr:hypothetical protein P872_09915 [Rhodonellum psychrophilum GCM71 = DSM 17998]
MKLQENQTIWRIMNTTDRWMSKFVKDWLIAKQFWVGIE